MEREEIEKLIERMDHLAEHPAWRSMATAASDCRDARDALRHLLQAQAWRPIDDEAKTGKPVLLWCRHCAGEQHAVCWWQGSLGWQGGPAEVPKFEAIAYMPLPQPPSTDEERASATPSEQQGTNDHDT